MSQQARAVGIYLGTSYSSIAIYIDGQVKFIPNEVGRNRTPSVVSFDDEQRLIGDDAKEQGVINPQNTIYAINRVIGRSLNEPSVQEVIKSWPFKVVGQGYRMSVEVDYKGETIHLAPEEVSAIVVGRLKELAETCLGCHVAEAVITVPAHFNTMQRQSTKDAGKIAGLKVLGIISEPVAAALAYVPYRQMSLIEHMNLAVFSMDADEFDFSLIKLSNGTFDLLATNGDPHLGGKNIDTLLMDYFIKIYKTRNPTIDVQKCHRIIDRLKSACKTAKKKLTNTHNTIMVLNSLIDGKDFQAGLTRRKFSELCSDLFRNIPDIMTQTLEAANLKASDIKEVILVGGSTRIPKIKEIIQDFFLTGTQLNKHLDSELVITYGAAIQAYNMSQGLMPNEQDIMELNLASTTPLSLGLVTTGGLLSIIIPKDTKPPVIKNKVFTTTRDNQSIIAFLIYQGDKAIAADNHLLGQIKLEGIKAGKRGSAKIMTTFNLDASGVLVVRVEDTKSKKSKEVTFVNVLDNLNPIVIENMRDNSEVYRFEDLKLKEKAKAINELENYLYSISNLARDEKYPRSKRKMLELEFESNIKWLEDYRRSASQDDFVRKLIRVKQACALIIKDKSRTLELFI